MLGINDLTADNMDRKQFEVWDEETLEDLLDDIDFDSTGNSETDVALQIKNPSDVDNKSKFVVLAHWIVIFFTTWASYFNISATALDSVMHFMYAFFEICGQSIPAFAILASLFPTSLYTLYKAQGTTKDAFTKYIVCTICHTLYEMNDCVSQKNGKLSTKLCSFIEFPNHPHKNKRAQCGQPLLKEILCKNGSITLYPHRVYCYQSITKSMKLLLSRPKFMEMCENWRLRKDIPGLYRNIYDGKIWKKFIQLPHVNSTTFLGKKHCYGLMLNLDWLQPYKHSPYSVGVLYMSLLNLPAEERLKKENVILVGVLPGPKEPDGHQINNYLRPLVDEMKDLWSTGFKFKSSNKDGEEKDYMCYCAILCLASDIPAARKLSGFLSHSAIHGCHRCEKTFHKRKLLVFVLSPINTKCFNNK